MTSLPSETKNETHTTAPASHADPSVDLRCASAEDMGFLGSGSVDLVVTSPPYWNAREYSKYTPGTKKDRTRDYRTGFGDGSYESYLALMSRCLAEVYRVLKPGGICCINVSSVLFKTRMYPIPADLTRRLVEIGFEMKEELVWDKTHSACDRFGSFAKNPLPHLYYPNLSTERVLILRRPGPRAAKSADPTLREASRLPLTRLAKSEICNDVWHIASCRGGELEHSCPFPQDLVARLVLLYSHKGETVLDPFLGSGQTMVVARAYGRCFLGVDVEQKFVDYANSRIGESLGVRERQLIARYEHVERDLFLDAEVNTPSAVRDEGASRDQNTQM